MQIISASTSGAVALFLATPHIDVCSKEAGGPGAVFMIGGADAAYQASPFRFHDVVCSMS